MNNDFYSALTYEREQFPRADKFYKKILTDNIKITRWDYNKDSYHRKMQDSGIDLTIENAGREISISEKFRTSDFGDMFIELYSKFPNVIGWGHHEAADIIAYFTPYNTYIVDNKQLTKLIGEISKELGDLTEDFKDTKCIQYIYKGKVMELRKVPTILNNKVAWESVGVCIKWDDLKELGISITKYSRYERKN